jgi:hypothetical protein
MRVFGGFAICQSQCRYCRLDIGRAEQRRNSLSCVSEVTLRRTRICSRAFGRGGHPPDSQSALRCAL